MNLSKTVGKFDLILGYSGTDGDRNSESVLYLTSASDDEMKKPIFRFFYVCSLEIMTWQSGHS
jgi:hypothetical protein